MSSFTNMERDRYGRYVSLIDWSDLYRLYVSEKLTLKEIALLKHCKSPIVCSRLRQHGIPIRTRSESALIVWSRPHRKGGRSGKDCNLWHGGIRRTRGYITIRMPNHPHAGKNGYVYEHRLVMEKKLGRYLLPSEKVHHINGVKDDNREENLQLFSCQAEHMTTMVQTKRLQTLESSVKELQKQNRLLRWQIRQLSLQLQYKIEYEDK